MQNQDVKTESVHDVILKLLFLLCVENISWNYLAVFPQSLHGLECDVSGQHRIASLFNF